LAYITNRSGRHEIWVRGMKSGLERPLVTQREFTSTAGVPRFMGVVYSPDGQRIAFAVILGATSIWIAPAGGGTPVRAAPQDAEAPAWSPDGRWLACILLDQGQHHLAVIPAGGNQTATLVPRAPRCDAPPVWSPDGKRIACETESDIQLASPDGSEVRRLPRLGSPALAWSPDGALLYGVAVENGRSVLKSVEVRTGAVRRIADYCTEFRVGTPFSHSMILSLARDKRSFAATTLTFKSDLWLLEGFPQPRPWGRLW